MTVMEPSFRTPLVKKKRKYDNSLRELRAKFRRIKLAAAEQLRARELEAAGLDDYDPNHPRGGRSKAERRRDARMRRLRAAVPANCECPICGRLRPLVSRAWVVKSETYAECKACNTRRYLGKRRDA